MFQIQPEGVVTGIGGICYSYKGRPMIPVLIKGDRDGNWRQGDFLLDTGADGTILHSNEALTLGIDIDRYDEQGTIRGIDGLERPIYYKKGILVKIGDFLY